MSVPITRKGYLNQPVGGPAYYKFKDVFLQAGSTELWASHQGRLQQQKESALIGKAETQHKMGGFLLDAVISRGSEVENAALRLLAVSKLINQAVGDALSGLLLVEVIFLEISSWTKPNDALREIIMAAFPHHFFPVNNFFLSFVTKS